MTVRLEILVVISRSMLVYWEVSKMYWFMMCRAKARQAIATILSMLRQIVTQRIQ